MNEDCTSRDAVSRSISGFKNGMMRSKGEGHPVDSKVTSTS
jgi:hypothetical protein